ncbi:hypothetical protein NWP21_06130 [Anabaenopsis sp. FSS-46]|nr:hypothetical protein [Anabaenopsis sp. FSS-46]MDH6098426.1 hypothetical protein [Anabaenopsis sp. FSS-46]
MHPLAATLIHNGSAILAGLNGLRPLIHQDPPGVSNAWDYRYFDWQIIL